MLNTGNLISINVPYYIDNSILPLGYNCHVLYGEHLQGIDVFCDAFYSFFCAFSIHKLLIAIGYGGDLFDDFVYF